MCYGGGEGGCPEKIEKVLAPKREANLILGWQKWIRESVSN